MSRRSLALSLALSAALAPQLPAADVAIIKSTDAPAWRPVLDAIRRVAASHTLSEYDLRNDRVIAETVLGVLKGRPVIAVAMGPLAAQLVRTTLPDAPLVFCMVQEPARLGLVPGPNLSGVAFSIPIKNQIAAFRMVNPKGVRIGVLFNPDNTGRQIEEAEKAALVLRVAIMPKAVATERDIPGALRELLAGDTVDAIWIPPDPVLLSDDSRRFILAETFKSNRPVYSFSSSIVTEGALVSNGPDYASIGEEVGELINRMAGGDHSRIEMLVPRAELVINKKIAAKLKIEIPPEALKAANKVF